MMNCVYCSKQEAILENLLCATCAKDVFSVSSTKEFRELCALAFGVTKGFMQSLGESRQKIFDRENSNPGASRVTITSGSIRRFQDALKFLYQNRMYNYIRDLEGDIVECGVGLGNSLISWITLSYYEAKNRKIWGFDSFEGLPEPGIQDAAHFENNWQFSEAGGGPLKLFYNVLSMYDVPIPWFNANVIIGRGWFKDTFHKYPIDRIVLLHIDADLYESYKICFDMLAPKVVPGGIIILNKNFF